MNYITNEQGSIIGAYKQLKFEPYFIYLDEDEANVLSRHDPRVSDSNHELAQIYPEALSTMRRLIKEYKEEQKKIFQNKKVLIEIVDRNVVKYSEQEFWKDILLGIYINDPIERLQKKVNKLVSISNLIEYGDKLGWGDNKKVSIEKAKDRPITDFLTPTPQGTFLCCWHKEKTPSLHYYKQGNRVHCFGCNTGGDVIDVVKKLYNVDFLEAVSIINNK